MKVLHLAAGNRWTGAAAPAFAEVLALREAGVDAHYAYVGGYKLQAKIGGFDFAHPIIAKAQNPFSFASTVGAIRRLIEHHRFDIVHAHLTYDHWLTRFASRDSRIARTFHSQRVIRSDPFTRHLLKRTDLICTVNDTFRIENRDAVFTPPPLDDDQFQPNGPDVRETYGIPPDALLVMAIGKLSAGRGFEIVLRAFAKIRAEANNARLMIIGHGEHRPKLEALARELRIEVTWAGYHEEDLADHYRAANFLLFTAKGSDEGHRAVIEAMGCGTVPVAAPLDGMDAILDPALIAPSPEPDAIARTLLGHVKALEALRKSVLERSARFAYRPAAQRLIAAYSGIL